MDQCEFEYEGRKCQAKTSKKKPFCYHNKEIVEFGIARCKKLCPIHYNAIVGDNIRKFNKGITITDKLNFTRKLHFNEAWSFFGLQSKTEKEVKNNNGK